ncbi:MAG TPA: M56 family metallopeptidase [Chthoniobacteraceae bacterium]|nr:M56 family metallopeptidase [Chthoniobacteraceae bacterium]
MNLLLSLTLCGSVLFLLVWPLDRRLASGMSGRWRRVWWVLVAWGFLIPGMITVKTPSLRQWLAPAGHHRLEPDPAATAPVGGQPEPFAEAAPELPSPSAVPWRPIGMTLWALGAAFFLLSAVVATLRTATRWRKERLSTDSRLLELLENAKANAGISTPVALIVSNAVTSPALLGWLRPRLLLPRSYAETMPPQTLEAIFLHELAHLRAGDLLIGWLFTLVRAIHWFNPFAHLTLRAWNRFREEVADGDAIEWLRPRHSEPGELYGEALLSALRHAHRPLPLPGGVLALGENVSTLKHRMTMILQHSARRSSRPVVGLLVTVLLIAGIHLDFSHAQEPQAAAETGEASPPADLSKYGDTIAAMKKWLGLSDRGQYEQSWKESSAFFRKNVTKAQWMAAVRGVRQPLGSLQKRTAVSAVSLKEDGSQVTVQFETSFANLKYALETVTFDREPDGEWRASGYYIKPR